VVSFVGVVRFEAVGLPSLLAVLLALGLALLALGLLLRVVVSLAPIELASLLLPPLQLSLPEDVEALVVAYHWAAQLLELALEDPVAELVLLELHQLPNFPLQVGEGD
jgi:hypothetical protein